MRFYSGFMRFYSGFLRFYSGFLRFYSGFMRFYSGLLVFFGVFVFGSCVHLAKGVGCKIRGLMSWQVF